ncbi:hypothetical protein GGR45_003031 [Sphingomonas zeae]|nr:hypothetical protein [Sphingomonas zeae]
MVEVILLFLDPDFRGGFYACCARAFRQETIGFLPHPVDLWTAKKQRLALLLITGIFTVELCNKGVLDRIDHVLVEPCSQRPRDLTFDRHLGSNAFDPVLLSELFDCVTIIRYPPMPFQALRRDARANGVAEWQALGKSGIVAVKQGAWPSG